MKEHSGAFREFTDWLRVHGGRPFADRLNGETRLWQVKGSVVLMQECDDGGFEVWLPTKGMKVLLMLEEIVDEILSE